MSMQKIMGLGIIAMIAIGFSCQKDYACLCTKTNSGKVQYQENYVGSILSKKTADAACKKNMNSETDTLTNCHIE